MRNLRKSVVHGTILCVLCAVGIASAETPPAPHHLAIIALHPDGSAKAGRDSSPSERTDVSCHHLLVCAKLQAEALIERLDATAPGAFLRLSSGVGLGYRF